MGPDLSGGREDPFSGSGAHELKFTGTAGGYFRIWIVNLFLTVLTLGIYAAWAKVRTRRYFYGHTILAGHPFEYTARPLAILRGYLIVAAGFLLYILVGTYNPYYGIGVIGAFYGILPFLIFKSLRFRARYSMYRNIRFRFLGSLGESYIVYLFIPFLIPLSLGLIVPFWYFVQKRFFFRNFTFGSAKNKFTGQPGMFYRYFAVILLLGLAAVLLAGVAMLPFLPVLEPDASGKIDPSVVLRSAGVLPIVVYLFFLLFLTFLQQYLFARTTNYCLLRTHLDGVGFRGTLRARRLLWIRGTNYVAIFLSLGLLIPWTKVRYVRYVLANIHLIAERSLDEFTAVSEPEESALGEVTTDFFDFDIGL
jgi:uncharacterized membrane protein YjgN (DUF898 family)